MERGSAVVGRQLSGAVSEGGIELPTSVGGACLEHAGPAFRPAIPCLVLSHPSAHQIRGGRGGKTDEEVGEIQR